MDHDTHPSRQIKLVSVGDEHQPLGHLPVCEICNQQAGDFQPTCQHPVNEVRPAGWRRRKQGIREVGVCTSCGHVDEIIPADFF